MDTMMIKNEESGISETERKAIEERIRLEMKIKQEYEASLKEQEILNNIYTSVLSEKIIEEHVIPKMKEACEVLHSIESQANELTRIKSRKSTIKETEKQPGFRLNLLVSILIYFVAFVFIMLFVYIAGTVLEMQLGLEEGQLGEVAMSLGFLMGIFLPPVLALILELCLKKSRNKQLAKEYDALEMKRKPLEEQLVQYVKDNEEVYSFLPERYQTSFAADYVYSAFAEHRAQSMKEAFNHLEEEVKTRRIVGAIGSVAKTIKDIFGTGSVD